MGEITVPLRDRPYCNVGRFGAIGLGDLNLKHQLNGLGESELQVCVYSSTEYE